MAVANVILDGIRNQKRRQTTTPMVDRTLRPQTAKPTTLTDQGRSDQRASYSSPDPARPPRAQSYSSTSNTSSLEATEAAKLMYAQGQTSPNRPMGPDRTSSSAATAAAASAMGGQRTSSQRDQYQRSNSDYGPQSPPATSGYPRLEPHPEDNYNTPSTPIYNPAAYAQVNNYPTQPLPLSQPVQQPAQQPMSPPQPQQPMSPTQALYNPQQPAAKKYEDPVSSSPASVPRKAAPPATEPGTGRRIGLDHFNFLAVLGKGNFGKVMLAETKQTKSLYAIKVLKKEFIIENDEVESTRSEKRVFLIANKERHPFLLNLHACFQTETRVYFVMEYISGGDLMLHIQRGQFGTKRAQ